MGKLTKGLGIEKGYYQFTSHLIADLIRVVSKGSAPFNNPIFDTILYIIATVTFTFFSFVVNKWGGTEFPVAGCSDLEDDYGLSSKWV